MRIHTLTLLALAILAPALAEARKADFPERITNGPVDLVKIGEGTFRWMFLKVYEGALYLDNRRPDADPLEDVAKCLELRYSLGLTAKQFRESGDGILEKNIGEDGMARFKGQLDRINAAYRDVEKGDRYALLYYPGEGTTLKLNGRPLVTVEGADFAAAYFSIWLGDNPAKASFREDLLGR